ncbi:hemerythrin domain-containing protein [Aquisalimonas lutea]|uniref:hemerythrin domain-containing protein n=1 Tax=Aquisalimonas lutea TaxID=1327750 RepID=UPI0025B49962|nr:hemerythrin domain-containing protein [Aquisalimonas lutea]MDN3519456.1 hemerythrin domain-containing protein [Aquisalimonas lutea]
MNTTTLDRLRRDHRNLERLLSLLEEQLDVLERGMTPDFTGMASVVDCLTNDPARYHHPLEDLLLARLERRHPPSAEAIGHRRYQQERLAARGRVLLDRLRDVSAGQLVSRAQLLELGAAYCRAYRTHLRYEEAAVFPQLSAHLTPGDWLEQVTRFHWRRDTPTPAPPEQPPVVPSRFPTDRHAAAAADDGHCPLCAAS